MKMPVAAAWIAVLVGLTTFAAAADPQDRPRDLVVRGHGEVRVVPDLATIRVAVVRQGKEGATPRREASERLAALIKSAREVGIAERDLQSGGVQIHPEWDWDKGRRLRGFSARGSLELRVRDFDRIGDLLTALASAGADEIGEVVFSVADPRATEREALAAAMADARGKAEALAAASGLRLGEIVQITEQGAEFVAPPMPLARGAMAVEMAASSVPVQAGDASVSAIVIVRWALR